MKLSTDFVGTPLKGYSLNIGSRWTMNYAAAIGDLNPAYYNEEHPGGIIAPPLFPVAVTWPMIENISDNIESSDFPKEILFTQVHYSEQLIIHRPVRPGDNISLSGSIAAIMPHKAGTHVILRFKAEGAGGEPLFTEYLGAMMRGVECADEGREEDGVPAFPVHPETKEIIWEAGIPVSPFAPFVYDGCSNIHFPIHTSVNFARSVGLPGIILQGTATLAIAVRELLDREAGGDSGRVSSISCRFTGMVFPGTEIKVLLTERVEGDGETDLFFTVMNSEGKRAVSNGRVRLRRA